MATPQLVSTVPGALQQMFSYVQIVANTYNNFNGGQVGAYLGLAIGESIENNYLQIGDDETGELFIGYRQDWVGLPAHGWRKGEEYTIPVCLRVWSGEVDQFARLTDAFTLVNALMNQIMADPNGLANGSPNLTASGSWQITGLTQPFSGPIKGKGWGVMLKITVAVKNVRING
jgi:hypothetical protein